MLHQHEQIALLEGEIDKLVDAAERCRKISAAAKLIIWLGVPLLVASMLGWFGPLVLILALGGILGGIVLLGSNQRTWDDTLAHMRLHEAQRRELIDGLGLQTVQDG